MNLTVIIGLKKMAVLELTWIIGDIILLEDPILSFALY